MKLIVPKYNVNKILKLQRKLHDEVLLGDHGYSHSGEAFQQFVNHINDVIPKVDNSVLFRSLQSFAGVDINSKHILELSWRLAGNVHNLQNGTIVPFWSSQLFPEWAIIQIMSVDKCILRTTNTKNKVVSKDAAAVKLFILGGLASGRTITKVWPESLFFRFRTDFGFSKYDKSIYKHYEPKKKSHPLLDIREFTRMRFLALVTPEESAQEPGYKDISCSNSCKTWNKSLIKKRYRVKFECPKGYDLNKFYCYDCHIGYDNCPASCHPKLLLHRFCGVCKNQLAIFDDSRNKNICVTCLNKLPFL